jgi:hypothetical protein
MTDEISNPGYANHPGNPRIGWGDLIFVGVVTFGLIGGCKYLLDREDAARYARERDKASIERSRMEDCPNRIKPYCPEAR